MFILKPKEPKTTPLDEAIDNLVAELAGHEGDTEESTKICANIKTLCEANAVAKTTVKDCRVNPETIVAVTGNLAGIAMILSFEHVNVITSKALGFVLKTKL